MTSRFEAALRKLSPSQIELLVEQAEKMAAQKQSGDAFLSGDWAGCIDSEHTSGLSAQRDAMQSWERSIGRGLPK